MISASRRCPVPSSSSMSLVQIIECNNKASFNLPKNRASNAASSSSSALLAGNAFYTLIQPQASRSTAFGKRLRAGVCSAGAQAQPLSGPCATFT